LKVWPGLGLADGSAAAAAILPITAIHNAMAKQPRMASLLVCRQCRDKSSHGKGRTQRAGSTGQLHRRRATVPLIRAAGAANGAKYKQSPPSCCDKGLGGVAKM
jgi:hypothetical protein